MRRSSKIQALVRKCQDDYATLDATYGASRDRHELGDDFKILVKNIFENLRSCLDYVAHEVFEKHCSGFNKPKQLCFPIRPDAAQFRSAIEKSFPGLLVNAVDVVTLLESVQPYRSGWLGELNKLNNLNKHEDLADHMHLPGRRVLMKHAGGVVSIGPAIGIAPDAIFFGIPVDPVTRLPMPNNRIETTVEPWSDFYFHGMASPVNVFVSDCIRLTVEFCSRVEALVDG